MYRVTRCIRRSTNSSKKIFQKAYFPYFCTPVNKRRSQKGLKLATRGRKKWKVVLFKIVFNAEVAQLVERNLAKVEVAGSSLVFRSETPTG